MGPVATLIIIAHIMLTSLPAWKSIGLSLADNITTQATTAIGQTMSMMMNFAGKKLRATAATAANALNTFANPTAARSTHRPDTLSEDSTDPAYPASVILSTPITTFAMLLNAETDDKVDWDGLKRTDTKGASGLTFVKASLEHQLRMVEWTDRPPSCELKEAIRMSMEVRQLSPS